MEMVVKKLLAKGLLGSKESFYDILNIGGKLYEVRVRPYEQSGHFVERLEKALHLHDRSDTSNRQAEEKEVV